ncbi:serine O-acetyltransferase [Telmatospirillum sp.]|uniref:serine O-acetyltransferase n=1 Tax=Telmatospirillum sp. TaxID=2079197 RepID=UPI00283F9187|nr:serine O-acetyltransferase [Telmatospirillum sp.]MDR3439011.1 serine O-acetyltransferase [Telmatospirillum sp.]
MVFKRLREEIESIRIRDPAARSSLEILLCYPGLHALLFYRLAHWAWSHELLLLGRLLSHVGKLASGIEIHPGATIGERLFIDHGTGVVIGETAVVGDDVTLYQGVTLGGTSLHKGKRHPTLGNRVIVGSGAQVLGPILVGDDARVGANAVVLADVPAGVTMVGIPARAVEQRSKVREFLAYACDVDLPDPLLRLIEDLHQDVVQLRGQVAMLEKQVGLEKPAGDGSSVGLETLPNGADLKKTKLSARKGARPLT